MPSPSERPARCCSARWRMKRDWEASTSGMIIAPRYPWLRFTATVDSPRRRGHSLAAALSPDARRCSPRRRNVPSPSPSWGEGARRADEGSGPAAGAPGPSPPTLSPSGVRPSVLHGPQCALPSIMKRAAQITTRGRSRQWPQHDPLRQDPGAWYLERNPPPLSRGDPTTAARPRFRIQLPGRFADHDEIVQQPAGRPWNCARLGHSGTGASRGEAGSPAHVRRDSPARRVLAVSAHHRLLPSPR